MYRREAAKASIFLRASSGVASDDYTRFQPLPSRSRTDPVAISHVSIDQRRNDVLSRTVDQFCALRDDERGAWAHRRDFRAGDENKGIRDWRSPRAIHQDSSGDPLHACFFGGLTRRQDQDQQQEKYKCGTDVMPVPEKTWHRTTICFRGRRTSWPSTASCRCMFRSN